MSCSVGLNDIEDFTNELNNEAPRKSNAQITVKRNKKATQNPSMEASEEYEKG